MAPQKKVFRQKARSLTPAEHHPLELAIQHQQAGRHGEAEKLCRAILTHDPRHTDALNLLSLIACGRKEYAAAEDLLRRAIRIEPATGGLRINLGNVLKDQGRLDEAVASFKEALRLLPNFPEVHNTLGKIYHAQGRAAEAIASYQMAIGCRPNFPEACYNLGNVYHGLARHQEAIASYQEAIRLKPDYAQACSNLGNVFHDEGRMEEATAAYHQAITLKPDYHEAHYNLGNTLYTAGRLAEAIISQQEALRLSPENITYRAALTRTRQKLCDWSANDSLRRTLIEPALRWDGHGLPPDPFTFLSLPVPISPAEQQTIAGNFSRWVQKGRQPNFAFDRKRPRQRLRIGYVSGDFRNHAVAQLMLGLFKRHDRARVEIYAFSLGNDDGSPHRRRIQTDCDYFIDVRSLSAQDIARRINENGIDIAIDLNGYTRNSRPQIFAHRPAPIQIAWLGFPATMGAKFIDYIITDRIVTPQEMQSFFSERFLFLPNCYLPSDCEQPIAAPPPSRAEQGLPDKAFVFCCFNNLYKIEPLIFDVWMDTLKALPESILWLADGPEDALENLRLEAKRRAVDPARLFFARRLPSKDQHLARLPLADLALDTYYYNGHTSGSDALWAGLPLLSCPGRSFASRVGASLLLAIGLPELIAPDLAAYKTLAIRLATHPDQLRMLKKKLAEHRLKQPLFDTDRFVRDLEDIYWRIWQAWRRGHPDLT